MRLFAEKPKKALGNILIEKRASIADALIDVNGFL